MTHLTGQMGQMAGQISADLHFEGDHVCGTVSLPAGLQGSFCYADQTVMLRPGAQPIEL